MTCPHCTKAATGVWYGGYDMNCPECLARSIARSLAAFNAAQPGAAAAEKRALRDLYTRMLPALSLQDAHAAMLRWWRMDHAHLENA